MITNVDELKIQFNEIDELILYDCVIKYNTDNNYKKYIQLAYLNNPFELEILDIYLLEEVYRFGKNGIFKKLVELNQINGSINSINELQILYNNSVNDLKSLYVKNKKH